MSLTLFDWLTDPLDRVAFDFETLDGLRSEYSYAEIATSTYAAAAQMVEAGVAPQQPVAIVMPNCREFVDALFATWLAGATPAPLSPPFALQGSDEYVTQLSLMLAAIKPAVVTTRELEPVVSRASAAAGLEQPALVIGHLEAKQTTRRQLANTALLQFTSGSSGVPRASRVTWRNLESNIAAICARFGIATGGGGISWLPFCHDMGLIGGLLSTISVQHRPSFFSPEAFVRDPMLWMRRLAEAERPAMSPTTSFGIGYVVKRVQPRDLVGLDFTNVESIIVGAERIDPAALAGFMRLVEPFGLHRSALRPAYGLGEATLAVTGRHKHRPLPVVKPDWNAIGLGRVVGGEMADLRVADVGDGSGWITGCGQAMEEVEVRVLDERGAALPEGHVGEIVVEGPTVADGYSGDSEGSAGCFRDGELHTGDAGFLLADELFVLGRMGDALSVRGRQIFVEELEAKLSLIPGIKKGRCVVTPSLSEGVQGVAAIVEAPPGDWADDVVRQLRSVVGADTPIQVYCGEFGVIPKTSSGKPRRRVLWQRLMAGETDARLIVDAARLAAR